jgi:hypothetical protein
MEEALGLNNAIRYGLLITLGVVIWVIVAHLVVPNPCSPVHELGPLICFNLLEIFGIYLGLVATKRQTGQLFFKEGLKTGMRIATVYGLGSCVFFLGFILVLGSGAMCPKPGMERFSFWQMAAFGFAGQFLFAIFLGLIYSTIIAFLLATRRSEAR